MIEKTSNVIKNNTDMTEEYPNLLYRKACLYIRSARTSVDPLGPPSVITNCIANVPKVKIMQDTNARVIVFFKEGIVILKSLFQKPAPSIRAAS